MHDAHFASRVCMCVCTAVHVSRFAIFHDKNVWYLKANVQHSTTSVLYMHCTDANLCVLSSTVRHIKTSCVCSSVIGSRDSLGIINGWVTGAHHVDEQPEQACYQRAAHACMATNHARVFNLDNSVRDTELPFRKEDPRPCSQVVNWVAKQQRFIPQRICIPPVVVRGMRLRTRWA